MYNNFLKYRVSIKSVAPPYISQTAKNYEKLQKMCLIISRSSFKNSFKKVGKDVPLRGVHGEAPTKKFQMVIIDQLIR